MTLPNCGLRASSPQQPQAQEASLNRQRWQPPSGERTYARVPITPTPGPCSRFALPARAAGYSPALIAPPPLGTVELPPGVWATCRFSGSRFCLSGRQRSSFSLWGRGG